MQFEIEARFANSSFRCKGLSHSLPDAKGAIAEGGTGGLPSGHGDNIRVTVANAECYEIADTDILDFPVPVFISDSRFVLAIFCCSRSERVQIS